MYLGRTGFSYDLKLKNFKFIETSEKTIHRTITSEGLQGDSIASTIEIIDSLIINKRTYKNVMHFNLKEAVNPNLIEVTEIYYAKSIGLVKFAFNNGVEVERK